MGLTQKGLASLLGASQSAVTRWERGGQGPKDPGLVDALNLLGDALVQVDDPDRLVAEVQTLLSTRGGMLAFHWVVQVYYSGYDGNPTLATIRDAWEVPVTRRLMSWCRALMATGAPMPEAVQVANEYVVDLNLPPNHPFLLDWRAFALRYCPSPRPRIVAVRR